MGNPFVHVELSTTNIAAAKAFYKALFDWRLNDMPDGDYTMVEVGEGTGGGMMEHLGSRCSVGLDALHQRRRRQSLDGQSP